MSTCLESCNRIIAFTEKQQFLSHSKGIRDARRPLNDVSPLVCPLYTLAGAAHASISLTAGCICLLGDYSNSLSTALSFQTPQRLTSASPINAQIVWANNLAVAGHPPGDKPNNSAAWQGLNSDFPLKHARQSLTSNCNWWSDGREWNWIIITLCVRVRVCGHAHADTNFRSTPF